MDAIEIMLKEYETVRQESLNTMSTRSTVLSFGLATIGAIFTASIVAYTADAHPAVPGLALTLMIPGVSVFVLFIWLGEYQRMRRAGEFLLQLEQRINEAALMELLTWETYLRSHRFHMRYPYSAVVLLLVAISGISLITGLVAAQLSTALTCSLAVVGGLAHLGFCLVVIWRYFIARPLPEQV